MQLENMNKKAIWYFNGILAIALAILLYERYHKPSPFSYYGRLDIIAKAVAEYNTKNGSMPTSLADLGNPELVSLRGEKVAYEKTASNYTLSVSFPFKCEPKPGTAGAPPLPAGCRYVDTILSTTYSIEEEQLRN